MNKGNKKKGDDTPKWWDVVPSTSIKRETEDATADLFIAKNIKPKKQKKD